MGDNHSVNDEDSPTTSQPLLHYVNGINSEENHPKKDHSDVRVLAGNEETQVEATQSDEISPARKYVAIVILFFINLLNYMDRFTIAAVLVEIKECYNINNAMAGLLQTVFIVSYMLVAPIFGYLGDRYNRKLVIVFGMGLWSGFTFMSSFLDKPHLFPVFVMTRALVGVGEASYSTIAPTIIGDLFVVGPKRTRMLSFFFFATPVGSGLGYIVGSQVAHLLGSWVWALRITPACGIVAIILLLVFCPNPPRGASESKATMEKSSHSFHDDLVYLSKNKSFIFVTLGFTSMAFVMGSLTFWAPYYFAYAEIAAGIIDPCVGESCDYTEIGFIFGLITCIGGISGIVIGAEGAKKWKDKGVKNADPLVCGIGMLIGSVMLFIGSQVVIKVLNLAWVLIFLGVTSLCVTWTLVGDMTLYVNEPQRRSTANAVELLIGHLLGDAGSPYLVGLIADALMVGRADTYMNKYITLQSAMYVTMFVCVLGCGGFFMASLHVVKDKEKVENFIKQLGSGASQSTRSSSTSQNSVEMNNRIKPITGDSLTVPDQVEDEDPEVSGSNLKLIR